MRVLVVLFLSALSTVAYSSAEPVAGSSLSGDVMMKPEPEALGFWPFGKRKKKKLKGSSRLKKQNRRMGKKFRRQNDDTLRR